MRTIEEVMKVENISFREALDRKQRYLCIKAKTLNKWRKRMAIGTTTTEGVKGWTEGTLLGFKTSKEGNHVIASFRLETGDFCSSPFKNPVKLQEINPLMIALGLKPFQGTMGIQLPEKGDDDMMGMDTPIMINVKASGDFLNANGFKSIGGSTKPPF